MSASGGESEGRDGVGHTTAHRVKQTLVRGAQLVASPWKNGGGVTREIAIGMPAAVRRVQDDASQTARFDAFAWRVSLADVAQPGPFSRFDGIDRVLVLLSGAGMLLDELDGGGRTSHTHALRSPLDLARFAGEAAIDARLADGPTRDFNLMTRRGVATGEVDVWRGAGTHTVSAHVVLLFCAQGEMTVIVDGGEPVRLVQDDTLQLDAVADAVAGAPGTTAMNPVAAGLRVDVQGNGALLAIRIGLHDSVTSHHHP